MEGEEWDTRLAGLDEGEKERRHLDMGAQSQVSVYGGAGGRPSISIRLLVSGKGP